MSIEIWEKYTHFFVSLNMEICKNVPVFSTRHQMTAYNCLVMNLTMYLITTITKKITKFNYLFILILLLLLKIDYYTAFTVDEVLLLSKEH